MENELKCSHCGSIIPVMKDMNPTFYGRGSGDKLVEIICIPCWEKGVRSKINEKNG